MATTRTVKCRRCHGSGCYFDRGFCFGCKGAGWIQVIMYTPEEKAARELYASRRMAAYYALDEASKQRPGGVRRCDVIAGFSRLEADSPERFVKMLDSLDAGRVLDVVIALADYYTSGESAHAAVDKEAGR